MKFEKSSRVEFAELCHLPPPNILIDQDLVFDKEYIIGSE